MKLYNRYRAGKILKSLTIFILIVGWIFSAWPQISNFPPQITRVYATDTNVLPSNVSASDTSGNTLSDITSNDSAANPDTLSRVLAGNGVYSVDKNGVMWFDAFDASAIPDGDSISAVVLHYEYGAEDGYNGTNYVRYDNGSGLTNTTIQPSDISGWSGDLTYDLYAQGIDTKAELAALDIEFTSNDGGGPDAVHFDYIWITVTHTNTAPNAPSQDSPSNNQTGVSTTPTFTMTATDPDSNDLGYKVTIYSNSACTTVVSTHDQSITATGWSGTDASCTNNPTSCYASGTQGSFTLQSGDALTVSTQYWWKASAKDPDGNGSFTDSVTCNSFTTGAAISISLSTDGSVDLGYVPLNTTEDTTASGVNDVETASVDSGPADLDIRSTVFTEGGNTWTLNTSNGSNQVHWEFSPDGSTWTSFAAADTLYSLATNVSQSGTQNTYLRITMPTVTDSYSQYSTTVTIVASAP